MRKHKEIYMKKKSSEFYCAICEKKIILKFKLKISLQKHTFPKLNT